MFLVFLLCLTVCFIVHKYLDVGSLFSNFVILY